MEEKYLVIGGSTKCGTTSLFNYLEFHPQVCPSSMKESRFFWDHLYPIGNRKPVIIPSYDSLFNKCDPGKLRIEATPDYLYSKGSAEKIFTALPNVKLIFILRDPVDRLRSWYKFASQHGMFPAGMTFEKYIEEQKSPVNSNTPQHMRALDHGRYSKYLDYYVEIFGREKIKILFYEDLSANPSGVCKEICSFASLLPGYFDDFDFKVYNKSINTKSVLLHQAFIKFKRSVGIASKSLPVSMRKKLKLAGHGLEKTYSSLNASPVAPDMELQSSTRKFLDDYYSGEPEAIHQLTGARSPWKIPLSK